MDKVNSRLFLIFGGAAVAVAVLMVVLIVIDSGRGGSAEDLADLPQSGTTLGKENAPVTIRLYEDFQCPACAQFTRDTLPAVIDEMVRPGDAKLVGSTLAFLGPDSKTAATAALAASEQDRYWQYSHRLFDNQAAENSGYITDEFLTKLAEETEGLDVEQWDSARKQDSAADALQDSQSKAEQDGVSSTPTIVISGPDGERTLTGAVPIDNVTEAFEAVGG